MSRYETGRTGQWPLSLQRCPECHRLIWPWQNVGSFDPEGCSWKHHECHHAEMRRLFGPEPAYEGDREDRDPDYWRSMLWCDHYEERAS